jgi:UDP-N-acetylmuramyl pentapeptide phosphotransferase/UDP-N-acetylglucosamine-1-phosphate transferase
LIPSDAPASVEIELGVLSIVSAGAATALCTFLFAHVAQRWGWIDDGSEAPGRKLQARAVAPVGGAAILCGCGLSAWLTTRIGSGDWLGWIDLAGDRGGDPANATIRRAWIVAALLTAFAVGSWDDLAPRGLTPLQKLAGQTLAGICLGVAFGLSGPELRWDRFLLAWACALAAQNALNTFDNADGAAAAIGILGFVPVAPAVAAALCGFLPFNLWIRRRALPGPRAPSVPVAYLGDAGSHALGLLLLLHPQARLALALPLLDLARVALVRIGLGIAPWIGDRRHLAHRMMDRGWTPTGTVLGLCAIAAPLLAAGMMRSEGARDFGLLAAGALLTVALFIAVLRLCPART